MAAKLHFAENALALHLFFQRFQSLIDIVVADENLHEAILYLKAVDLSGHGDEKGTIQRALAERLIRARGNNRIDARCPRAIGIWRGKSGAGALFLDSVIL
jgi:hypothetical protein